MPWHLAVKMCVLNKDVYSSLLRLPEQLPALTPVTCWSDDAYKDCWALLLNQVNTAALFNMILVLS